MTISRSRGARLDWPMRWAVSRRADGLGPHAIGVRDGPQHLTNEPVQPWVVHTRLLHEHLDWKAWKIEGRRQGAQGQHATEPSPHPLRGQRDAVIAEHIV